MLKSAFFMTKNKKPLKTLNKITLLTN